jgi:hypothetical protein
VKKIHLQKLVGSIVRDVDGKVAGRLASAQAEIRGGECVITEYRLGKAAYLARLGISARRLLGLSGFTAPVRVPWERLDISDPAAPRLLCRIDELPKA